MNVCECVCFGVNFTNILSAAFSSAGPKSAKKTDSLTVFFAVFKSFRLTILVKLTLGLNFINVIHTAFTRA